MPALRSWAKRILYALKLEWVLERARVFRKWREVQRIVQAARLSRRVVHHELPAPVIISLTSYPKRFRHLHRTLQSLLEQSLRPDKVVLWIAEADYPALPRSVTSLVKRGLSIELCEDTKSFKKLLPALAAYPDAFIATADDDVYYEPSWLSELVAGYDSKAPAITCHRAHRMRFDERGRLQPYENWEWDVQDSAARLPNGDIMPTGVGGILYFPNCFDPEVENSEVAVRLCPSADDLWFFWMARRKGSLYRKVGDVFPHTFWPGSQEEALTYVNHLGGENNKQIKALQSAFPLAGIRLD